MTELDHLVTIAAAIRGTPEGRQWSAGQIAHAARRLYDAVQAEVALTPISGAPPVVAAVGS